MKWWFAQAWCNNVLDRSCKKESALQLGSSDLSSSQRIKPFRRISVSGWVHKKLLIYDVMTIYFPRSTQPSQAQHPYAATSTSNLIFIVKHALLTKTSWISQPYTLPTLCKRAFHLSDYSIYIRVASPAPSVKGSFTQHVAKRRGNF